MSQWDRNASYTRVRLNQAEFLNNFHSAMHPISKPAPPPTAAETTPQDAPGQADEAAPVGDHAE